MDTNIMLVIFGIQLIYILLLLLKKHWFTHIVQPLYMLMIFQNKIIKTNYQIYCNILNINEMGSIGLSLINYFVQMTADLKLNAAPYF